MTRGTETGPRATQHELCAARLAKYKRPVAIEILDELPKNPIGKLDKPALRTLAAL